VKPASPELEGLTARSEAASPLAKKHAHRNAATGGSDPDKTFGRIRGQKVGSLPPNLVFFSVSLFSFSCRLFPRFPGAYAHPQAEEHAEDEAEEGNSYLLQLLRPNSRRAHRRKFLVGLERPTIHFGHAIVCKSGVAPAQHGVLPASKLIVAPCASSCYLGTCSIAMVTARVTHMVIFVFHAHITSARCK
jgi:hypothetical protein